MQAGKQWLEEHIDWLLILDNADDLGLARPFLPVTRKGHILLTKCSHIFGKIARQLELQEMEQEKGVHFLLRRAKVLQDGEGLDAVDADVRKAASHLVILLGSHLLALDQAGAYIEETEVSFAEYNKLLREHRNHLMHRQGTLEGERSEHPESVATTMKMSISRAIVRQPIAGYIIHIFMLLQADVIPEEVFQYDHELELLDQTAYLYFYYVC